MPVRVIHWYRCSRCGAYQRLPRSMRETSVQVASVTNAEPTTRRAHSAPSLAPLELPHRGDEDHQSERAAADVAHEDARTREIERQEAERRPPRTGRSKARADCADRAPHEPGEHATNTKIACAARMPSMPSMKLCRLIDQTIATSAISTSDATIYCADTELPRRRARYAPASRDDRPEEQHDRERLCATRRARIGRRR